MMKGGRMKLHNLHSRWCSTPASRRHLRDRSYCLMAWALRALGGYHPERHLLPLAKGCSVR
jgi:hypothetical protein